MKAVSDPLYVAIAEVGRLIEAAPRGERHERVRAVVDSMSDRDRLDFVIGVFVWVHAMRLDLDAMSELRAAR